MHTLIHGTEPRNARVEVISVNLLASAGPLRAFPSVRLDGVTIHDYRILQHAGHRAWGSLPQYEYLHAGQKNYAPVMELSESLKREVSRFVLAAWERRASDAR